MTESPSDSGDDAYQSADEDVEDKKLSKGSNKPLVEQQKMVETLPNQKAETPSSWRSWGAFSVISNASKHVASITTQVSQSITTAIEEMNIPEPEEMARMQKNQESQVTKEVSEEESLFKLDSLLSNVTNAASRVVSEGLGTLEVIGKKTINIMQETDPNIKNKLLTGMKVNSQPNLSSLLREAAKVDEPVIENSNSSVAPSFEHLLDEHKGLVFLEALEILSNQSKMKIELLTKPLSGKVRIEMDETLAEVKELCDFDSDNLDENLTVENCESKLDKAIEDLNVKINFKELVSYSLESSKFLDGVADLNLDAIYEKSIQVIAKICALSLNNLQKLAELLLSQQDHRSTVDEADALIQLFVIYASLLNYFAVKFSEKMSLLNEAEGKNKSTNIFLECSNAVSHVKRAFNLFIPVLQIGAV